MIDLAATIEAMKASGMDDAAIVAALACVRSAEVVAARTRTPHAIRQERYRQRHKASQSVTSDGSDADSDADAVSPKEIPPIPPKEITPSDIPPATPKGVSAPKPTPRSELAAVLSPLQADAVVAHRQRIGKPMTAHAARLLAGKFAKCPSPDAAADAMIANGWQGFEPGWMERSLPRAGPTGRQSPIDHFRNFANEITDGQNRNDRGDGGNWDDAPGLPVRTIEHHG